MFAFLGAPLSCEAQCRDHKCLIHVCNARLICLLLFLCEQLNQVQANGKTWGLGDFGLAKTQLVSTFVSMYLTTVDTPHNLPISSTPSFDHARLLELSQVRESTPGRVRAALSRGPEPPSRPRDITSSISHEYEPNSRLLAILDDPVHLWPRPSRFLAGDCIRVARTLPNTWPENPFGPYRPRPGSDDATWEEANQRAYEAYKKFL